MVCRVVQSDSQRLEEGYKGTPCGTCGRLMIIRLISILRETDCLHLLPAFRAEGVEDGLLGKLTDRDLRLLGVDRLGDRMRLLAAFASRLSGREARPAPAGIGDPNPPGPQTAGASRIGADGFETRAGALLVLDAPAGVRMEFRWCPPGRFVMGSPLEEAGRGLDEGPVEVEICGGFWMGRTPVTQELWGAVLGSAPSHRAGARRPVENVSWEDAVRFVSAAGRVVGLPSGYGLALPTEAQWEYACRAGTATPFAFGRTLSAAQANYNGNHPYAGSEPGGFLEETSECGSYPPNAWGLCDMHGNVWEWCADWYGESLAGGMDPMGPDAGPGRVYRGGSWHSVAEHCRSAFRYYLPPGSHHMFLGFRVAMVAVR